MIPPADPGLEDLFGRLSAGDPAALEEVCRRYGPRVTRIVRRRMGSGLRARLETADLAQETMATVVEAAPGVHFRTEADFLRWLQDVAEKRVLHAARHWRADCRSPGRESACGAAGSFPDRRSPRPSQVLLHQECLERLHEEMGRLSPAQRRVIMLRLVLQLPWRTIAASLGTSEECAQMRFARARRLLANALH